MEKEHLRGAEEDDYIIMEDLIQRRLVLSIPFLATTSLALEQVYTFNYILRLVYVYV